MRQKTLSMILMMTVVSEIDNELYVTLLNYNFSFPDIDSNIAINIKNLTCQPLFANKNKS